MNVVDSLAVVYDLLFDAIEGTDHLALDIAKVIESSLLSDSREMLI